MLNESELKNLESITAKAVAERSLTLTRYEHGGGRLVIEDGNDRKLIADFYDEANREHYAAFDPTTCAELMREVLRLREQIADIKHVGSVMKGAKTWQTKQP